MVTRAGPDHQCLISFFISIHAPVTPAKAGVMLFARAILASHVSAFAGMTVMFGIWRGDELPAGPIPLFQTRPGFAAREALGSDLESSFLSSRSLPEAGFRIKGFGFTDAKHALFRNDGVLGKIVAAEPLSCAFGCASNASWLKVET